MKVIIDPSFIPPDDMTQDELDSMIKEFEEMIEDGTLEENSEPLSEEEYEKLVAQGYISDEEVTKH